MNDLEHEIRETLHRREDDAPTLDASDVRRAAGRTRRRQIVNVACAGIGTLVLVIGLVLGLGGLVRADRGPTVIDRPTVPDQSCPSPTSGATPAPNDAKAHGWPTTTRNPAGVYSWGEVYSYVARVELQDGSRPKRTIESTSRFMHNGYSRSPGEVSITMEGVPGQLIPHRGQCAVVGGYEGTYRRFIGKDRPSDVRRDDPGEEWMVDIEGTTVTIPLFVDPNTPEAELAEAHDIIESIYMVPKDNIIGFRLLFTIPTNTWDSG
jgi:hypothetical protein